MAKVPQASTSVRTTSLEKKVYSPNPNLKFDPNLQFGQNEGASCHFVFAAPILVFNRFATGLESPDPPRARFDPLEPTEEHLHVHDTPPPMIKYVQYISRTFCHIMSITVIYCPDANTLAGPVTLALDSNVATNALSLASIRDSAHGQVAYYIFWGA